MILILTREDLINTETKFNEDIKIEEFKIPTKMFFLSHFVVYTEENKFLIYKNRYDGFVGKTTKEKILQYIEKII